VNIGERLRVAREAIGYTQPVVASKSGVGVSSISDFENGKREPSFSQLSRFAEVYKKSIDFFLTDTVPAEAVPLWRDEPETEEERKEAEARFRQLCDQYHRIEVCTGQVRKANLPKPDIMDRESFDYAQAGKLANKVQRELHPGDVPSGSLKQILEERFYVKVFHLEFPGSKGSAICIFDESFGGPAILLNKDSKLWRRNFDLAHELFHLLTWDIFRVGNGEETKPSEEEEKLANAFASRLLLPTDSVKDKVDSARDSEGKITLEALDEIAREFGVSLDALLWRMLYLYNMPSEQIVKYIEKAKKLKAIRPLRKSDDPDELPERYCSLAIKALRKGKLSLMQFKKYMNISYREAEEYLTEDDEFREEEISIPAA
jgi:Zn-dependent peptidase ImmA (M78 family)/DNA-binding XRE family transcriptional regulator